MKWRVPDRGDVYQVSLHLSGSDAEKRLPYVVVSPKEVNCTGIAVAAPIFDDARAIDWALSVPIVGRKTAGAVVCNQVRSFDLQARNAEYIETLDATTVNEIVSRVISYIDPAAVA